MKVFRSSLLFTGLLSDFNTPIPNDIVDEMLENIPDVMPEEGATFSGQEVHIPFKGSDGIIYYWRFFPVEMTYGNTTVVLSEVPRD